MQTQIICHFRQTQRYRYFDCQIKMTLLMLLFKIGQKIRLHDFNYFHFFFRFYPKESAPGKHSFWKLVTSPKVALIAFVINALSSCFGFLEPTLSLFVVEKVSSLVAKFCLVAGGRNCFSRALLCGKASEWLQGGGRMRTVRPGGLCDVPVTTGLFSVNERNLSLSARTVSSVCLLSSEACGVLRGSFFSNTSPLGLLPFTLLHMIE